MKHRIKLRPHSFIASVENWCRKNAKHSWEIYLLDPDEEFEVRFEHWSDAVDFDMNSGVLEMIDYLRVGA